MLEFPTKNLASWTNEILSHELKTEQLGRVGVEKMGGGGGQEAGKSGLCWHGWNSNMFLVWMTMLRCSYN